MRSCEYLKVPTQDDRKTKLLCLRNIRFFIAHRELVQHLDDLSSATLISITFKDQKNREKNQTINLHKSKDSLLCPVKAWSKIVKRIWSYEGTSRDSPVNCFQFQSKPLRITSANVISYLRATVAKMPDFNLGFDSKEVGTHSIRSVGAMALCLAEG